MFQFIKKKSFWQATKCYKTGHTANHLILGKLTVTMLTSKNLSFAQCVDLA